MDCLDENSVLALLGNALLPQRAAEVHDHLDECEQCRRLVAGAVRAARPSGPFLAAPSPPSLLPPGSRLGRYVVQQFIGAGGMGLVYAAYDPDLERKVALKLVRTDLHGDGEECRLRLVREGKAIAQLAHPNVVTVFDIGLTGEQAFVAMELVEGGTLGSWLRERPRRWREILRAFLDAGQGLAAAHQAGVVHRDFKPENVLIGAEGRPRVSDFGLARPPPRPSATEARPVTSSTAHLTQTGALLGTPAYMAPEQLAQGVCDTRSDQYSFCVALWEALYGSRPTPRTGAGEPTPRQLKVPRWVENALRRGLSEDPRERFPSMEELLRVLRSEPVRRARVRWALATLAILAAGIPLAIRQGASQSACMGLGRSAEQL
ncbi:MAG: serine/threonine protein kinase, partial [Deltaproteobacteria bacterium]|nr:serine/threonine protein kinase [Deltaproteobacteria bacterium]